MCDVLDGIALSVGEVIHRVDAPLVTGTMVRSMLDTIEKRVAEHHVRACHVNLRPEDFLAVSIFAGLHVTEKLEVLFHAPVSVRAFHARLVDGAASLADFFLSLVIDVCQSPLYQVFSPFVQLVEIVRSISFLIPLETKPLDVFLNGIHVLGVFLGRVGIVETQVRLAAIFLRQTEVNADTFRMSKVQISVRLRRETGQNAVHFPGLEIGFNDFFEEIQPLWLFNLFLDFFHHTLVDFISIISQPTNLRKIRSILKYFVFLRSVNENII